MAGRHDFYLVLPVCRVVVKSKVAALQCGAALDKCVQ